MKTKRTSRAAIANAAATVAQMEEMNHE